jgi:hypothetical protein
VKVLDFGVSKSLSDSGEGNHALTQTSSLVGSPLYMSAGRGSAAVQRREHPAARARGDEQ